MKELIFIVEDEPDIVELVSHHLEKVGYKTKGFYNAYRFLNYIREKGRGRAWSFNSKTYSFKI